ncbi:MAG TPA: thioredoxin family protein [Ferrovibrio sp.]|uniref:DUF899 domain-containing protein n=1 Tax=Ferrovibrio sp. TaxID=1917215 RepID=UPI002ED27D79
MQPPPIQPPPIQPHRIVSREDWIAARKDLLAREKELTRLQDQVNEARRALPWVTVDKNYIFDTPQGRKILAELFGGRSQLFVYHFMFAPDWKQGCLGCSFFADHIDGPNQHLAHHDLTVIAVSRAPLEKIQAYKKRMGWKFTWVSSAHSDFNYDFNVSFRKEDLAKGKVCYNYDMIETTMEDLPGASVFYKDESGTIYHTYSAFGRGDERGLGAYMFLDMTPKGRNETRNGNLTDWVKRHDEYAREAVKA